VTEIERSGNRLSPSKSRFHGSSFGRSVLSAFFVTALGVTPSRLTCMA
jgi:hypothetical protein